MDSPGWNGEPGALPSDPEWRSQADGHADDAEDLCPLCEATAEEGHFDNCSLFKPRCDCGRFARRMIAGEWYCTTCAPHGRVQAGKVA